MSEAAASLIIRCLSRTSLLIALLVLAGCGVYRVEQVPLSGGERAEIRGETVSVVQQGDSECVGGILFIFTVGLFPMICDEVWVPIYEEKDGPGQIARSHTYTLRTLKGWPYLWLMPVSPNWHYGYSSTASRKIEQELNSP